VPQSLFLNKEVVVPRQNERMMRGVQYMREIILVQRKLSCLAGQITLYFVMLMALKPTMNEKVRDVTAPICHIFMGERFYAKNKDFKFS
jgi:hypothetical protein